MTARQMIELLNRVDFHPLEIHLNDGHVYRVDEPFLVSTSPSSPTLSLYEDDLVRIISYRNIAQVVTMASSSDS